MNSVVWENLGVFVGSISLGGRVSAHAKPKSNCRCNIIDSQ